MKLLILTQKIDINDPILGFFVRWIEEFAKHCESLTVICLQKGEYKLPKNVKILSLGKEKTLIPNSRFLIPKKLIYTINFFKYIWQERRDYDTVFVHMNQIYIILGGVFWRLFGKKIGLWYAHGSTSLSLRIAEKFSHKVFTSTQSGFRINSKKVNIIGQGIDTNVFVPLSNKQENKKFSIISVGRISPIKDYKTLINAVEILYKDNILLDVNIVGDTGLLEQETYLASLKKLVGTKGLTDVVHFKGAVLNKGIVSMLQRSDLFVNTSHTGSLDKAMLEAMSVGLPVITCNEAAIEILDGYAGTLFFEKKDFNTLASHIKKISKLSQDERKRLGLRFRNRVVRNHDLSNLSDKILKNLT